MNEGLVLIVEDDYNLKHLYKEEVEDIPGYKAIVTDNYTCAIDCFKIYSPDYVITNGCYPILPYGNICEQAGLLLCSALKQKKYNNVLLISSDEDIVHQANMQGWKAALKCSFNNGFITDVITNYKRD